MVSAVRGGACARTVARRYGVSHSTVLRWLERARGRRLDRVDWEGRSKRPRRTQRTSRKIEDRVLVVRRYLKKRSVLGEYGAPAILQELERRGFRECPSVRTIGRILERRGALDGQRRVRRPPPPRGWFLPEVGAHEAELDRFDTIEGLAIRGGPHLSVLTAISLHGGLVGTWVHRSVTARVVVQDLFAHWSEHGCPDYALFDNDLRFIGPRQHRDAVGQVIRLCVHVGVVPVFATPLEHGFQADIESYNGRWQAKVWSRFRHRSVPEVCARSDRYVQAVLQQKAARIASAPPRSEAPSSLPDLAAALQGRMVFLRRTNANGHAKLLGHSYLVHRQWTHRLVRAEVDLTAGEIRFHALRRQEPQDQPILATAKYKPRRPL